MRIKELAELAGTTVRTIRFYHQIGLLAVPRPTGGRRDYDLAHVARMIRIRWLAQAGIPLSGVAEMLDGQPVDDRRATVLADLHAVVATLDDQLHELRVQRDRMCRLITTVRRDGHLSPLPAPIARFYDRMYERATDERTRRVIRDERDFMELACYRGDMPPEAAIVYERLTAAGLADSFAAFGQIAERVDRAHLLGDEEIAGIAGDTADRLIRQLGEDAPGALRSIDPDLARQAADLYVQLAEPGQRRLARAIGDALLATIEKGRTP
ncbi:MerR family transcriptional regulator [Actinoplanes sp. L3-i22]|uniref:MerR family transcriptional regulator n=1 Tax=Actinoplanes sp. L3-i22 TaxID=2836373 RepID=UPI001C748669|nr:MerR family transcriptional regulator [Actinoplanes sp. L3-i22]BCY09492.1 hypothetical protein L3i22_045800 [Actinoplanes sp. L3-i22]